MKRLYKYSGHGHYLGCTMILIAENTVEADEMISVELKANGLSRKETDVLTEHPLKKGIIFIDNGDY